MWNQLNHQEPLSGSLPGFHTTYHRVPPRVLTLHLPSCVSRSSPLWLMKSLWPSVGFSKPHFPSSYGQLPLCLSLSLSSFLLVPFLFIWLWGTISLSVTSVSPPASAGGDAVVECIFVNLTSLGNTAAFWVTTDGHVRMKEQRENYYHQDTNNHNEIYLVL